MRSPRHVIHLLALLAAVVLGVACGVSTPSAREGSVEVVTSALGAEDVATVTLTMTRTAPSALTRETTLVRAGDQWRALLGDLPLGTWTFDATALDVVNVPIFHAHAEGIAIDGTTVPLIVLVFQPTTAPTPYENTAPLIDALALSSRTARIGQVIRLQAIAHDPNTTDTLSYIWSATGGTLSRTTDTSGAGPATVLTEWTAPATPGPSSITITVGDQKGLQTGITFTIETTPETSSSSSSGTTSSSTSSSTSSTSSSGDPQDLITRFTFAFNVWPNVLSVISTSDEPIDAQANPTTTITVTASDADGDRLHVDWSASGCSGTFAPSPSADMTGATTGPQTNTITFTRTDSLNVPTCDIVATVTDGDVANTGTLFLATIPAAAPAGVQP